MTATLHFIHDPLCGWCYAAQPLVSAAIEQFEGRLQLELHGGGLFGEPRQVTAEMARHLMQAAQRIAALSGQPFGQAHLEALLAEHGMVLNSLPPITAVLAARELDPEAAYPMLVAIQQAHYQRGLRVVEPPVLGELAEQIGLDGARFALAYAGIHGTTLYEHVQDSRRMLGEAGGQGLPALLLESAGQRRMLPHQHYYGQPDAFVARVAALLPALH